MTVDIHTHFEPSIRIKKKTCLLYEGMQKNMLIIVLLSSSPCTSLVVKAAVLGLRRCDIASTVASMVAVMVAFMVACFPGLIVTELILRFLVLLIVTDCEGLVQVVRLVFVDVVNAVWIVSFSHLFPCTFFVGICLTTVFISLWLISIAGV
jgi:hypothetical protein